MSFRLRNGQLVRKVETVRKPLPVVDCSSCTAACCQYQGRPPLTDKEAAALPEEVRLPLLAFDAEVSAGVRPLPGRLARRILAGDIPTSRFADPADIEPCLWLDTATHRCRHHEHRPQACADFAVGGADCLTTRREFRVPLPMTRE
jgi:Fe-S-cluster containining protein